MREAIKSFQTLDGNSIVLLIILKGNMSYVLEKCMFMFKKYLIVTNVACFSSCNLRVIFL